MTCPWNCTRCRISRPVSRVAPYRYGLSIVGLAFQIPANTRYGADGTD